ncbi:MAG TPA: ferritin-like domain-containing protein [Solirubrobacteraceae bacterium]|nr:ferritin-like domain-containing protein [Solirubrobacteraceae bacterium]
MTPPPLVANLPRRRFLQICGTTAAGVVIAGCGNDDDGGGSAETQPQTTSTQEQQQADVMLDFSEVAGVLNYAYALEQLEAAFYTQARETVPKPTESEYGRVIDALKGHEVAHREFFKQVLGDNAVGALEVNFESIDFSSEENVLEVASTFENLGVAAYNGAAKFLAQIGGEEVAVPLMAAGDIVAVEARHASVINELSGKSFAPDAFDEAMEPSAVLEAAAPFLKTTVSVQNA